MKRPDGWNPRLGHSSAAFGFGSQLAAKVIEGLLPAKKG